MTPETVDPWTWTMVAKAVVLLGVLPFIGWAQAYWRKAGGTFELIVLSGWLIATSKAPANTAAGCAVMYAIGFASGYWREYLFRFSKAYTRVMDSHWALRPAEGILLGSLFVYTVLM